MLERKSKIKKDKLERKKKKINKKKLKKGWECRGSGTPRIRDVALNKLDNRYLSNDLALMIAITRGEGSGACSRRNNSYVS